MRYLTGNGNTEDGLYFYHGNHLSSTQLITDINANISQAVLYTPWGSVIKEYKADWMLDTIPRYLFNAKEKDEESGLYYYEARYYSDEDIVFRARDPLFEEKPFMSPYAYCRNNPINMIDPDGRDEYEVDVVNQKITVVDGTQGTPDKFTVIKQDGTRVSSDEYAHGTVEKLNSSGIESYGVTGDKNGKEMFEFLAKETGVEWAHFQTGEGGENGTNYLFTSFEPSRSKFDFNVMKGEIRVFNHNHPNGSTSPGPEDPQALLDCQSYNYRREGYFPPKGTTHRMPASFIYTNDGCYTPFDPPTKELYERLDPAKHKPKN
jgi:RHS repeat-associated protein